MTIEHPGHAITVDWIESAKLPALHAWLCWNDPNGDYDDFTGDPWAENETLTAARTLAYHQAFEG